jgi:hypothetical protein
MDIKPEMGASSLQVLLEDWYKKEARFEKRAVGIL